MANNNFTKTIIYSEYKNKKASLISQRGFSNIVKGYLPFYY
tara:strand:- start:2416 stop:2538 length:123 start_codon:yes stop_codon:yes gene_type:complete